jgi:hypothetical protein
MDVDFSEEEIFENSRQAKELLAALAGVHLSNKFTFKKRICINRVIYSVVRSHKGNAMVEFYGPDSQSTNIMPAVIEQIAVGENKTYFAVRRYLPLSANKIDPFQEFIDFPAQMYSTTLATLEFIEANRVKSHVACFFLDEETVIAVSLSRY